LIRHLFRKERYAMKKILKKRGIMLIAAAILALTLGWLLTRDDSGQMKTDGKSPFQAAPLERYEVWTEQERYRPCAAEIKILVRNDGETIHEFFHPVLEWKKEETWYSLKKEERPAVENLLYIEPGETKTFSLWPESYGHLEAGHYRAVLPVWGSTDYIAAEFDIAS